MYSVESEVQCPEGGYFVDYFRNVVQFVVSQVQDLQLLQVDQRARKTREGVFIRGENLKVGQLANLRRKGSQLVLIEIQILEVSQVFD